MGKPRAADRQKQSAKIIRYSKIQQRIKPKPTYSTSAIMTTLPLQPTLVTFPNGTAGYMMPLRDF